VVAERSDRLADHASIIDPLGMTERDQLATVAANEATTRRLYQAVWNERRIALVEEWVTPDFVGYYSAYPAPVQGLEGFRGFVTDLLTAFPDVTMTLQETMAVADKVVSRVRMTGTHNGAMLGFAPTGRKVDVEYIAIERYLDGLCVEEWVQSDDLRLSRQIGALPEPGSAGERAAKALHRVAAARMRRKAT
jgi:predicted ester cyclase